MTAPTSAGAAAKATAVTVRVRTLTSSSIPDGAVGPGCGLQSGTIDVPDNGLSSDLSGIPTPAGEARLKVGLHLRYASVCA